MHLLIHGYHKLNCSHQQSTRRRFFDRKTEHNKVSQATPLIHHSSVERDSRSFKITSVKIIKMYYLKIQIEKSPPG